MPHNHHRNYTFYVNGQGFAAMTSRSAANGPRANGTGRAGAEVYGDTRANRRYAGTSDGGGTDSAVAWTQKRVSCATNGKF